MARGVKNQSTYPPQPANAKGEVHEDEGFISLDRSRKKLVLRQFHVEGFVNQYVEDEGSTSQQVRFTSEQIENIPDGGRRAPVRQRKFVVTGAPCRTRTCDLLVRSQTLYPTELRAREGETT
jgi:hypothetical protein